MICPNALKLLFTDASSVADGYYSQVLAQLVPPVPAGQPQLPKHLNIDNKVDRYIFDNNLPYKPIPCLKTGETIKQVLALKQPPDIRFLGQPYLGYEENTVHDSLFLSAIEILKV